MTLIDMDRSFQAVKEVWDISRDEMLTKTRKHEIVEPRQLLICYFERSKGIKAEAAADFFGLNRSTFYHCKRIILDMYITDKSYRERISQFLALMNEPEEEFIFSLKPIKKIPWLKRK